MRKMSKITLFLWEEFGQNFTLAEGLWSIPCLQHCHSLYKVARLLLMAPKTLQIMSPILLHQLSVQWKMTILEDNLRNENSSYKGEDLEVSSKIKCTSKIKTNLKLTRLSSIESQPKKVDVVVVVVVVSVVVIIIGQK